MFKPRDIVEVVDPGQNAIDNGDLGIVVSERYDLGDELAVDAYIFSLGRVAVLYARRFRKVGECNE